MQRSIKSCGMGWIATTAAVAVWLCVYSAASAQDIPSLRKAELFDAAIVIDRTDQQKQFAEAYSATLGLLQASSRITGQRMAAQGHRDALLLNAVRDDMPLYRHILLHEPLENGEGLGNLSPAEWAILAVHRHPSAARHPAMTVLIPAPEAAKEPAAEEEANEAARRRSEGTGMVLEPGPAGGVD